MDQPIMMLQDCELEEVDGGWIVAIPIALAICGAVGMAVAGAWDRGYQLGKDLAQSGR